MTEERLASHMANNEEGYKSDIESLVDICHLANRRWYINPVTNEEIPDTLEFRATKIALMHSELSEMLEGMRKNKMDDHIPEMTSEAVEAADVLIRLMDYCGRFDVDIASAFVAKMVYNLQRPDHRLENRAKEDGKKF